MTAVEKKFVRLLHQADERAREEYPEARFLFADGRTPNGTSANVDDFGMWRFAFAVEEGTIFLANEKPWDPSFVVEFVPQHMIGARGIPVPSVQMDITDADRLIRDTGYKGPYSALHINWPLAPLVTEPHYTFQTPNAGYWSIGVYTGKISHHS
ncbi:hypothetical protein ACFP1Z_22975 [Streptomyces gamaensis]|uniref:Uncharacterized protein n=1 Tax=Streptomyces gamaensis TaxID=1763542 RepID=A0ABW0Z2H0_9ACTN